MIDYYNGIDTETRERLPYLEELSTRIHQEQSAETIYQILFSLSERLEERAVHGNETKESRQLAQELPEIKLLFFNQERKEDYDKRLADSLREPSLKTKENTLEKRVEILPVQSDERIESQSSAEDKSGKQQNILWISLSIFFLIVLAFLVVFLKLNPIVLLIFILLLVLLNLLLG